MISLRKILAIICLLSMVELSYGKRIEAFIPFDGDVLAIPAGSTSSVATVGGIEWEASYSKKVVSGEFSDQGKPNPDLIAQRVYLPSSGNYINLETAFFSGKRIDKIEIHAWGGGNVELSCKSMEGAIPDNLHLESANENTVRLPAQWNAEKKVFVGPKDVKDRLRIQFINKGKSGISFYIASINIIYDDGQPEEGHREIPLEFRIDGELMESGSIVVRNSVLTIDSSEAEDMEVKCSIDGNEEMIFPEGGMLLQQPGSFAYSIRANAPGWKETNMDFLLIVAGEISIREISFRDAGAYGLQPFEPESVSFETFTNEWRYEDLLFILPRGERVRQTLKDDNTCELTIESGARLGIKAERDNCEILDVTLNGRNIDAIAVEYETGREIWLVGIDVSGSAGIDDMAIIMDTDTSTSVNLYGTVSSTPGEEIEYYGIDGRRLMHRPSRGIYIERSGNQTRKRAI